MITLNYLISPDEELKLKQVTLANITASDLDYYLFRGDIIFRVDEKRLDTEWGWVPVVEFATQLFLILTKIVDGEERFLEFTESEATIRFLRHKEIVDLEASYVDVYVSVDQSELRSASIEFFGRILEDISAKYPDLSKNPSFRERQKLLLDIWRKIFPQTTDGVGSWGLDYDSATFSQPM